VNSKERVSNALNKGMNTYWQAYSQEFMPKNEPKHSEYVLVKRAKIWQGVSMFFHPL